VQFLISLENINLTCFWFLFCFYLLFSFPYRFISNFVYIAFLMNLSYSSQWFGSNASYAFFLFGILIFNSYSPILDWNFNRISSFQDANFITMKTWYFYSRWYDFQIHELWYRPFLPVQKNKRLRIEMKLIANNLDRHEFVEMKEFERIVCKLV